MAWNTTSCYFHSVAELGNSRAELIANIAIAVLNSVFSLISLLGNAFVISVIWKREALHVPYNTLLGCLAFSDFVVGLIGQPSVVALKVVELRMASFATYCSAKIVQSSTGWLTAGVSLSTLCAISLDRYLALRLHMRYATVVTVPRVLGVAIFFWVLCLFFIIVRFFMAGSIWMASAFLFMFINLALISIFYGNVFQIIRRHRRQIHARMQLAQHFHGRSAVEVARHKRSAVTMMYVLASFVVCYLPFLATIIVDRRKGYTSAVKIAYDMSATFVLLSSSLNPFLYCWRVREIRQEAIKVLMRLGRVKTHVFPKAFAGTSTAPSASDCL